MQMHCLYFKATVDRVQRRIVGAYSKGETGKSEEPPRGDSNYALTIKIHKTRSRFY